jgi:hypothetical protein
LRSGAAARCDVSVDEVLITPPADFFVALVVPSIAGKSAPGLETLVALPDGVGAWCDVGVTPVGTLTGAWLAGPWGALGVLTCAGGVAVGTALGSDGTGVAVTGATTDPAASATSPSGVAAAAGTPKTKAVRTTPTTEIPERRKRVDLSTEFPVRSKKVMIPASLVLKARPLISTPYLDIYTCPVRVEMGREGLEPSTDGL